MVQNFKIHIYSQTRKVVEKSAKRKLIITQKEHSCMDDKDANVGVCKCLQEENAQKILIKQWRYLYSAREGKLAVQPNGCGIIPDKFRKSLGIGAPWGQKKFGQRSPLGSE